MAKEVAYQTGHVKRDPLTGWVAVRTIFPETDEQFRAAAWQVATPGVGARNASTVEVEGWDDLFVASTSENSETP